ncbi:hypothetical protein M422DRAFT_199869 [Sphaerobolus stellatus SS14]|nr:hypothetical protein M422DRAFT_199869 [Sphaerobolus stellatus SS14]
MDDHSHFTAAQWNPHLLPPSSSHSPYPSPTTAVPPSFPDSSFYHHAQSAPASVPRPSSGLSLNISSLSVASSSVPSTAGAMSPVTPLSPTASSHLASQGHPGGYAIQQQHHPNTFRFAPPDLVNYESSTPQQQFDPRRPPGSSRSSSSEKSVPRKRSITNAAPSMLNVEEEDTDILDDAQGSIDDSDMCYGAGVESSSPGSADEYRLMEGQMGAPAQQSNPQAPSQPPPAFGVLGKTGASNNFVAKLYQMINDSKSAQFITWTELGTSFMVSNVGEFSRTILGSHFKHNNFSSFVRQLNMYGFHKINRSRPQTPRAQRTSTDAQTWEFSHPKFLRGRTDLLEDIKRKSLEQDLATLKQRIELPAEVASQLHRMGEAHRRTAEKLEWERRKVERLTEVVKSLWDVVDRALPGQCEFLCLIYAIHALPFLLSFSSYPHILTPPLVPMPFPAELFADSDNPPILITEHEEMSDDFDRPSTSRQHESSTRPSTSHSQPSASLSISLMPAPRYPGNTISPSSSPTMPEFPHGGSGSYNNNQQMHHGYDFDAHQQQHNQDSSAPLPPLSIPSSSSPNTPQEPSPQASLPPSSAISQSSQISQLQQNHIEPSPKRQRVSRARSDSAPLGVGYGPYHVPTSYGVVPHHMGRPRSGSNLAGGAGHTAGQGHGHGQMFLGRYGQGQGQPGPSGLGLGGVGIKSEEQR